MGVINKFAYDLAPSFKSFIKARFQTKEKTKADDINNKMKILNTLKNRKQYLPLLFKNILAIGFLSNDHSNNDTNNTVDDSEIFNDKDNIKIDWVNLDKANMISFFLSYFKYIGVVIPAAYKVAAALSKETIEKTPGIATTAANSTIPVVTANSTLAADAAQGGIAGLVELATNATAATVGLVGNSGAAAAAAGTVIPPREGFAFTSISSLIATKIVAAAGAAGSLISGTNLIIAGFVLTSAYDLYNWQTAENVDINNVIDSLLVTAIFNTITEINYITVSDFKNDDKLALIFINNIEKLFNESLVFIEKINPLMSSTHTLANTLPPDRVVLFNSIIEEPVDIKDRVTNLNIPLKSIANALSIVKSTYNKETGEGLKQYYENKDAFLEKLKKQKNK